MNTEIPSTITSRSQKTLFLRVMQFAHFIFLDPNFLEIDHLSSLMLCDMLSLSDHDRSMVSPGPLFISKSPAL
jgi:hypothetical protein